MEDTTVNITQLKYFHAVATYHTVSLAAQHLYISQPSLSNAIKELEKEFSVNLFYRRYNGMVLTPAGTKLYNSVTDLLSRYEAVEQLMRTMGKDGKQLRLGIPPMISSFILADIYKDLILTEKNIESLRRVANENGMTPLWTSCRELVFKGQTSIHELMSLNVE